MIEIMENRFIFRDKWDFVYCYNCKTEMAFDGRSYECPVCGSVYTEKKMTPYDNADSKMELSFSGITEILPEQ